jgi:serine/threonine protein kinase
MNERSIFLEALEKANVAERAAYLDAVCGEDGATRHGVEKLLAAHEAAGGILDRPPSPLPLSPAAGARGRGEGAVPEGATGPYESLPEGAGTVIGPYKLLQKIGEGGFGVVYMAEQTQPIRRMVALKIIKPGMDTALVIARFESERQALALMDHPHIAKVLDAGATESGRPYFVMELVKGVAVTEFCDTNHLPPEARLKLFQSVCHAIQHAHHKGIIHRDIKPSNVMVTLHDGVPVVKVIDFGVAKATGQKLTERTLFTAYGQMIGTPAYMSPEQAEMSGLDIDTRSDVYALGVLLYELLTGTTPLEGKRLREAGYAEMQRLIREEEAPPPSNRLSSLGDSATVLAGNRGLDVKRLVRLLAGDLDWVVMKALDKDRGRRYDTPGHFAEDVERYLRREAIQARPPSTMYRLKKFLRRNWVQVLTAAVFWVATMVAFQVVMQTVVGPWIREHERPPTWLEDFDLLTRSLGVAEAHEAETRAVLDFVVRLRHIEKTRDAAGCRATAERWEKLNRGDAESLYLAACLRAATAAVLQKEPTPGADATRVANEEADRAMAWLKQAVAAGYRDTAHLKADPVLDALRDREDFQKLVAELEANPTAKKPSSSSIRAISLVGGMAITCWTGRGFPSRDCTVRGGQGATSRSGGDGTGAAGSALLLFWLSAVGRLETADTGSSRATWAGMTNGVSLLTSRIPIHCASVIPEFPPFFFPCYTGERIVREGEPCPCWIAAYQKKIGSMKSARGTVLPCHRRRTLPRHRLQTRDRGSQPSRSSSRTSTSVMTGMALGPKLLRRNCWRRPSAWLTCYARKEWNRRTG